MPENLSPDAIDRELADLRGWVREDSSIARTWERKGFNGAIQLANVVAYVANELNHHPDIRVHDYKKVTVTTRTHATGGVTEFDVALAKRINTVVDETAVGDLWASDRA